MEAARVTLEPVPVYGRDGKVVLKLARATLDAIGEWERWAASLPLRSLKQSGILDGLEEWERQALLERAWDTLRKGVVPFLSTEGQALVTTSMDAILEFFWVLAKRVPGQEAITREEVAAKLYGVPTDELGRMLAAAMDLPQPPKEAAAVGEVEQQGG